MDDQTAIRVKKIFTDIEKSYSALLVQNNNLLSEIFQSGKSEALRQPKKEDIEKQKTEVVSTSLVTNNKFLIQGIQKAKKNVLSEENAQDALRVAMKQIASMEAPVGKELVKKLSKGRQKTENPVPVKKEEYLGTGDMCPCCGTHFVTAGEVVETIKSEIRIREEQCRILEQHHELQICPKCGKAHVVMPAGCDHPILPNRTIGTHSVIEQAQWLSLGLPLQKSSARMNSFFQLGSDTLYYNLRDLNHVYLAPLVAAILSQAKKEEIIVADETSFPVLEAQGKGHRGNRPLVENPKNANYVFALGSAPDSVHPFNLYFQMGGRGAEDMKQFLTPEFKFQYLVTDGYNAYRTIMAEHPLAKHQCCLIHFRRELLKAIISGKTLEKFEKSSPAQQDQILDNLVKSDSKYLPCFMAVDAIRKIYALRNVAANQTGQDLLENQQKQRSLMDDIDTIMNQLAINRVTKKKTLWQIQDRSDPVAAACCYYLNRRDQLRLFLTNFTVPCDSNSIENAIRPIAVIRRNLQCMQSLDGAEALLNIVSVFKTLAANGIKDPITYLRDYCRALYQYMVDKEWTRQLADGKDPNKRITSYDFKELREDFDFNAWMPWNR